MTEATIGIDISKDRLDVHHLPDGETAAFGNDKAGLKRLKPWLGTSVRRVVFEPAGRYHLALERRLPEARCPERRSDRTTALGSFGRRDGRP